MSYLTLDQQQSLFHSEIISIKEILIGIQIRLNCFLLLLINSGLENLRQFSSCIYIQGGLEQIRQKVHGLGGYCPAYTYSWSGVMEWSGAVEWSGIFGAVFFLVNALSHLRSEMTDLSVTPMTL